jgi:hypothetical protein
MTGTVPTSLDPWRERGVPLDKQFRSWRERIKAPYDKQDVDPYTRCRVILMNGLENECWAWSHHFARHTDDPAPRRRAAGAGAPGGDARGRGDHCRRRRGGREARRLRWSAPPCWTC